MHNKLYNIIFLIAFIIMFFLSCMAPFAKPYDKMVQNLLQIYLSGDFKRAYQKADDLVSEIKSYQKQDYYLSLLERGKIALAIGDYKGAIYDLQRAEKRFLKIENTISTNEEAGALFTNDLGKEYITDPHEMLFISPYLALAYLMSGDFASARVERNRTINKINRYIEKSGKRHLENAFSRFISALIYEMEEKFDDVKIEYRKMAKSYKYLKHFKNKNIKKQSTSLVVILDIGLAPYKYEIKYGPSQVMIGDNWVTVAFAYAGMAPSPRETKNCTIFIDNKKQKSKLLYNVERTIMQHYNKTKKRQLQVILKRVIAKLATSYGIQSLGNYLGRDYDVPFRGIGRELSNIMADMEKADLRNWSTLPRKIHYSRFDNLESGSSVVQIEYTGGVIEKKVNIRKDQINLLYVVVPGY